MASVNKMHIYTIIKCMKSYFKCKFFPCYPAWSVVPFTYLFSVWICYTITLFEWFQNTKNLLISNFMWKKISQTFGCHSHVHRQLLSRNPTAPCFLQHSFSYFNSLFCTRLMVFCNRRLLVGCGSHRLLKKLGVLLSESLMWSCVSKAS